MEKGFKPSGYLEKIKPPYITGALTLIGAFVLAGGIALYFTPTKDSINLEAFAFAAILAGMALIFVSGGYFLGRRLILNQAEKQEETNFHDWVYLTHNIELTPEQTDQLYTYGSTTTTNGQGIFLQKEFTKNGSVIFYLHRQEELEIITETLHLPEE